MREIKFRVWDGKKLFQPNQIDNINFRDDGSPFRAWTYNKEYILLDYKTVILQYTGLKDKNGVEIYEADILKCTTRNGNNAPNNFQVLWDSRTASFVMTSINEGETLTLPLGSGAFYKHKEVIGNIYESPELLNRSQES